MKTNTLNFQAVDHSGEFEVGWWNYDVYAHHESIIRCYDDIRWLKSCRWYTRVNTVPLASSKALDRCVALHSEYRQSSQENLLMMEILLAIFRLMIALHAVKISSKYLVGFLVKNPISCIRLQVFFVFNVNPKTKTYKQIWSELHRMKRNHQSESGWKYLHHQEILLRWFTLFWMEGNASFQGLAWGKWNRVCINDAISVTGYHHNIEWLIHCGHKHHSFVVQLRIPRYDQFPESLEWEFSSNGVSCTSLPNKRTFLFRFNTNRAQTFLDRFSYIQTRCGTFFVEKWSTFFVCDL